MNVLILGANSDIAHEIAKCFAKDGATCLLASRNTEALASKVQDLQTRYSTPAHALPFDLCDYASHAPFYANLEQKPDVVVLAGGLLGEQEKAQEDFAQAKAIIDTNLTGAISILEIIAADFAQKQQGHIIGISSVAGLRGRADNYIYGASKAGLTAYLSGLRNRLHSANVAVLTVLPGFIQTKMTAHMKAPGPLAGTAEGVAKDIHHAYKKQKNILYTPKIWRLVMKVFCAIPESLFKKMAVR